MANIERIKVEARREELEEQKNRATEITQRVEEVSTPQRKMEDSDKLAREALEKLNKAKKAVDILREDFNKITNDISVKKYLEKRGITTLEDYVTSDEGKDTDLAKRYQEVADQVPNSRDNFRSKIKERGEAKDDLLVELEKNETSEELRGDKKEGIRTYSSLKDNANRQVNEIPEKEIEDLVDNLVDKKIESLEGIVSKIVKAEYDNTKVISESDIIELQKYGKKYYYNAEKMFQSKITKLATEMVESSANIAYDEPNFDKRSVSSKESYVRTRINVILEKINSDLRDSKGKVESNQRVVDNIIGTEEITAKLEAIKPEIEDTFSRINEDLRSNLFNNWVDNFYASYGHYNGTGYDHEMCVVFKKFDPKQNPFSKYFSFTIDNGPVGGASGASTYESLSHDRIGKNISTLEEDEKNTRKELSDKRLEQSTFSGRGFIDKFANKKEGRGIDTKIKEFEEKLKNLAEAKKLLLSLSRFTSEMDIIMKKEPISSLRFDSMGAKPPQTYGASFIEVIDDEKKRLNQYIKQ